MTLTVVPFTLPPVEPGKATKVARIKRRLSHPDMKAAFCVTINKDGQASMLATTDDPMVLSYMQTMGEMAVAGILLGEEDEGDVDIVLDDDK